MDDCVERQAFGGGRMTVARRRAAQAVARMSGAFTADDLAEAIRHVDPRSGSTATVYRSVAAMVEAGYIERVGTRHGSALYARCNACDHHHHIVCDCCGITAVAECPADALAEKAAQASGFTLTRHEITLYGLCPECARKADR